MHLTMHGTHIITSASKNSLSREIKTNASNSIGHLQFWVSQKNYFLNKLP